MKYEVKIRIKGVVSYVNVTANSVAQAIQQVKAMYGPGVEVLGTNRR
jgi:hypothetical protein